jgi:hypothetical protein
LFQEATMKVQVLTTCYACKGKAYVPVGEALDANGKPYTSHKPCVHCEGSGLATRWVSLQAFITLLQQAQCQHNHTSYRGSLRLSQGEPWDDIIEYCDDCSARLDGNPQTSLIRVPQDADVP